MKRKRIKKTLSLFLTAALALSAGTISAAAAQTDSYYAVGTEDGGSVENGGSVEDGGFELPERYSSVDMGYVTPVKAQDYSSCWAYASMATLESTLLHDGNEIGDMSTNHLNMWATTRSNGKGWIRNVFKDGFTLIALGYMTSWQGGVLTSDLGEYPLDTNVKGDQVPTDLARYGVTAARYLNRGDFDIIKQAIYDHGGVFTSYAHSGACMNAGNTAYYMPESYNDYYSGHSIEVVGWNDNFPRTSFSAIDDERPENNGAWLIKGSWGDNNSLGGYYWISYEDKYLFSSKFAPSYALLSYEKIDNSKKLVQNEIYGATYEFKYVKSKTLTYLNRLHFDSDFNVIDKVVFETTAAGASYSIYFVPDGSDETPDNDTSVWTKLGEGTVDYEGYICADIEDFEYPSENGSIAVTIDASGTDINSSIGVGEWLTYNSNEVFTNESGRGESYIIDGGTAQDLMDWYLDNNQDDIGGTFVIKAVTKKHYLPTLLGDSNLDGKVNINDVTHIQRHLAELITLDKTAAANADFNRDGKITVDDVTKLQRFLAGFEDE